MINEKSLTVYCKDGFLLENNKHYTASEQFSGGQFAEDYYKEIGENVGGSIDISTDTKIRLNGNAVNPQNYLY